MALIIVGALSEVLLSLLLIEVGISRTCVSCWVTVSHDRLNVVHYLLRPTHRDQIRGIVRVHQLLILSCLVISHAMTCRYRSRGVPLVR